MSKKLPVFKTDKEAENFLDQDLSDYISAENFAPFQFEFRPKQKSVNLRISEELLNAVRAVAHRQGIPYQQLHPADPRSVTAVLKRVSLRERTFSPLRQMTAYRHELGLHRAARAKCFQFS